MPMMMLFGFNWWWMLPVCGMVLMVGFFVMTRLNGWRFDRPSGLFAGSDQDPMIIARERFARGIISHQEFEMIVEKLVRTEPE